MQWTRVGREAWSHSSTRNVMRRGMDVKNCHYRGGTFGMTVAFEQFYQRRSFILSNSLHSYSDARTAAPPTSRCTPLHHDNYLSAVSSPSSSAASVVNDGYCPRDRHRLVVRDSVCHGHDDGNTTGRDKCEGDTFNHHHHHHRDHPVPQARPAPPPDSTSASNPPGEATIVLSASDDPRDYDQDHRRPVVVEDGGGGRGNEAASALHPPAPPSPRRGSVALRQVLGRLSQEFPAFLQAVTAVTADRTATTTIPTTGTERESATATTKRVRTTTGRRCRTDEAVEMEDLDPIMIPTDDWPRRVWIAASEGEWIQRWLCHQVVNMEMKENQVGSNRNNGGREEERGRRRREEKEALPNIAYPQVTHMSDVGSREGGTCAGMTTSSSSSSSSSSSLSTVSPDTVASGRNSSPSLVPSPNDPTTTTTRTTRTTTTTTTTTTAAAALRPHRSDRDALHWRTAVAQAALRDVLQDVAANAVARHSGPTASNEQRKTYENTKAARLTSTFSGGGEKDVVEKEDKDMETTNKKKSWMNCGEEEEKGDVTAPGTITLARLARHTVPMEILLFPPTSPSSSSSSSWSVSRSSSSSSPHLSSPSRLLLSSMDVPVPLRAVAAVLREAQECRLPRYIGPGEDPSTRQVTQPLLRVPGAAAAAPAAAFGGLSSFSSVSDRVLLHRAGLLAGSITASGSEATVFALPSSSVRDLALTGESRRDDDKAGGVPRMVCDDDDNDKEAARPVYNKDDNENGVPSRLAGGGHQTVNGEKEDIEGLVDGVLPAGETDRGIVRKEEEEEEDERVGVMCPHALLSASMTPTDELRHHHKNHNNVYDYTRVAIRTATELREWCHAYATPSSAQLMIVEVSAWGSSSSPPSSSLLPTVTDALLVAQHVLDRRNSSSSGGGSFSVQKQKKRRSGRRGDDASGGTLLLFCQHPSADSPSPLHHSNILSYCRTRFYTCRPGRSRCGRVSFLLAQGIATGTAEQCCGATGDQTLWPHYLTFSAAQRRQRERDDDRLGAVRDDHEVSHHYRYRSGGGGGKPLSRPPHRANVVHHRREKKPQAAARPMQALLRQRAQFHRRQQGRHGPSSARHHRPLVMPTGRTSGGPPRLYVPRLLPEFTTARYTPEKPPPPPPNSEETEREMPSPSEETAVGTSLADSLSSSRSRSRPERRQSIRTPVAPSHRHNSTVQRERAAAAAKWEAEEEAFFGVAFDMVAKGGYQRSPDDI